MTGPAIVDILTGITDREGRPVTELPPLYEAIDPEALAAVLDSDVTVTVRFEYDGAHVVVRSDPLDVTVIDDDR